MPAVRERLLENWSALAEGELTMVRTFGTDAWILRLDSRLTAEALRHLISGISRDPRVDYAEKDIGVWTMGLALGHEPVAGAEAQATGSRPAALPQR